jgi:hypothetical protein
MRTIQCDKCGSVLSIGDRYEIGQAIGHNIQLCAKCFQPFFELLKQEGLLSEEFLLAQELGQYSKQKKWHI